MLNILSHFLMCTQHASRATLQYLVSLVNKAGFNLDLGKASSTPYKHFYSIPWGLFQVNVPKLRPTDSQGRSIISKVHHRMV